MRDTATHWTRIVIAAIAALTTAHVAADTVQLVDNGKPLAVLVLPDTPAPEEQLAAEELSTFFEQMSGARITATNPAEIPDGMLPIRVGLSLCPEAQEAIAATGGDPGSFLLRARADGVWLAGFSPEATLFAAYELLEQLGVGWYMPGELGTVVPKATSIALPLQETLQVPSFTGRKLQAIGDGTWARRMRLGGMDAGGHGLGIKVDPEENPEMFCQENGKPTHQLLVSHPEVLRLSTEAALDFFRKNPDRTYISMSPNDGAGFGSSPWDAGDMDPLHGKVSITDRYIKFYNLVLAEVHKEFPEAGIAFYCYGQLMRPPVREIPDPHLLPVLAPIDLCRFHSMDNPLCTERAYMKWVIDGWQELGCPMFYRGFFFNLADQGLPFSMIRQISDEIPDFHRRGFIGCRVQCMPMWGHHGPSLYLAAKLMWNADAEPKAIIDDYFASFYGPASGPMQAYFQVLEDAYADADYHTGNVFDIPHILRPAIIRTLDNQLAAAEKAVDADSDFAKRVALTRLTHDYGKTNLEMMAAFNTCDFTKAKTAHDRAAGMIEEGLSMSPPLFYKLAAVGYLRRFWGASIKSASEGIDSGNRIVAKLPDEWLFMLDPLDGGEALGFYRPDMGTNNWLQLKTYSQSWSNQGLRYYKGETWYRTSIELDNTFRDETIWLWLGGVDDTAKAWINGQELPRMAKGAAPIGRPWEFEATNALRFGGENTIVIKVTNRTVNEIGTGGLTGPGMLWTKSQAPSKDDDTFKGIKSGHQ